MKNLIVIFLSIIVALSAIVTVRDFFAKRAEFRQNEALVAEATECIETGDWKCAERDVRHLLSKRPDDENLQDHLAGILLEQERYEECRQFIAKAKRRTPIMQQLDARAEALIREMNELGLEKSMHFRVEFEGRPAKSDIMEALAVLEVAYDSISRLFDFRPENKLHLVLYQSSEYQGIGPRPDWVAAVFDGKLRVPVNAMRFRELYRPVLFHELTHAFVRAMTRAKVPLWLNEGIAQIVDASRDSEPRPMGAPPGLHELTEAFVNENDTQKAVKLYWYSQKMVEHLLYRDGAGRGSVEAIAKMRVLSRCIQDMRTLGIDGALQKHFGLTAEQVLAATVVD